MIKVKVLILFMSSLLLLNCRENSNKHEDTAGKTEKQKSLIQEGAELKLLAQGFEFTEGPVSDKEGNVFFTDQPNNRILKWSIDGELSTFMEPSGRSNGLYIDKSGNLWACADEKNELWLIDEDKNVTVLTGTYHGKLLNGPNDVWVSPNGNAYFTDPYYQRPYWNRDTTELSCEGVYLVNPKTRETVLVIDDLVQPNGIVGSPDGKKLFVADIGDNKTYSFTINEDGTLSNKKLFVNIGSDGMTMDNLGDIYLTNGQGVTVFDSSGQKVINIPIEQPWTANVCFGGKNHQTLFITASKALYVINMNVHGVNHVN